MAENTNDLIHKDPFKSNQFSVDQLIGPLSRAPAGDLLSGVNDNFESKFVQNTSSSLSFNSPSNLHTDKVRNLFGKMLDSMLDSRIGKAGKEVIRGDSKVGKIALSFINPWKKRMEKKLHE